MLREAFARGEDIHTATAAEVLGKDPATLTKDERNVAKMVNFGIIYGISAFGLSENLEIPREQAQAYIDTYLARFPHVQDFIRRTVEQAERDGYVTTLLGRRRPVPEIRASNRQTRSLGERLAVNSVMQGTAADVIKVAMVRIHERLRAEGRGARLVLQVHDELLLELPEPETSAVKELVRDRDGRRLSARPAARRRRRHRRELGRGEGLAAGLPQADLGRLNGDDRADRAAATRGGVDLEDAAEELDALAHPEQAEAGGARGRVEADAVVLDGDPDRGLVRRGSRGARARRGRA